MFKFEYCSSPSCYCVSILPYKVKYVYKSRSEVSYELMGEPEYRALVLG